MLVSPSSFGVGPMKAACWVFWHDPLNNMHTGVVTAGHGLPAAGETIEVQDVTNPGTVVLRSDVRDDGIDVGLVEVDSTPRTPVGVRNLPVADVNTIISLISTEASDEQVAAGELWAGLSPTPLRALAFMTEYPIKYPDGNSLTLRDVLVADGRTAAFAPGQSGATWMTYSPQPIGLAVAIQSYGRQPDFDVGLGTHFDTALKWISGHQEIRDLHCSWTGTESGIQ
jgi:hypothetical protein